MSIKYEDMRGRDYPYISSGCLYVVSPDDYHLGFAKEGDVGMDLPVVVEGTKLDPVGLNHYINVADGWLEVPAFGSAEIPTGLRIKVPDDAWGNIRPRSSTLWKKRLTIIPTTIDSGYNGSLIVLVFNYNNTPIRVHQGDRLAQLILIPKYPLQTVMIVSDLPATQRGATGFGSTGGIKEPIR
jgi:dUTP pyrophosphatase